MNAGIELFRRPWLSVDFRDVDWLMPFRDLLVELAPVSYRRGDSTLKSLSFLLDRKQPMLMLLVW